MTDCPFETLLPRASTTELALEQEFSQKYCRANPEVIRTLYDPDTCPIELLPWLAYALSVDIWNEGWTEVTKRAVCQNSLQMHLHKGTIGGIEDAFAALGMRAEITEWWQANPVAERGTMSVMLWINQNIMPDAEFILGAELIRDVKSQLDRSKRASIHYTYKVGVMADTAYGIAASAQLTTYQRLDVDYPHARADAIPTAYGIAGSAQLTTMQRLNIDHPHARADASLTTYGIAASAQLTTVLKLDAVI